MIRNLVNGLQNKKFGKGSINSVKGLQIRNGQENFLFFTCILCYLVVW